MRPADRKSTGPFSELLFHQSFRQIAPALSAIAILLIGPWLFTAADTTARLTIRVMDTLSMHVFHAHLLPECL